MNAKVEVMPAVATKLAAVPAAMKKEISSVTALTVKYSAMTITTEMEYQAAAVHLRDIKSRGKTLEAQRKTITDPMNAAMKAVMDLFRPAVDGAATFERIIKQKMGDYVKAQEKLRQVEEARAQEEARNKQNQLNEKAEMLREKGKDERADVAEMQAATTIAVAKPISTPVVAGISNRKVWKAKLVNKMDLIKAVAEGRASPELLDYNESVGNGLAKALKLGLNVPGLQSYEDIVIAAR